MSKKPRNRHKTNPQNAQKSTGPKTPEGKAVSSQNAAKHHLFSERILLPHESAEDYQNFCRSMMADLKPVGEHETYYTTRYINLMWRLERGHEYEAQLWKIEDIIARNKELDRLSKAMARVENQMFRAHKQFRLLQIARLRKEESQPAKVSYRDMISDYLQLASRKTHPIQTQGADTRKPQTEGHSAEPEVPVASFCKSDMKGSQKGSKFMQAPVSPVQNGSNGSNDASKSS